MEKKTSQESIQIKVQSHYLLAVLLDTLLHVSDLSSHLENENSSKILHASYVFHMMDYS